MALQVLSDLHLESPKLYDIFEVAPKSSILALLGDIGTIGNHKSDLLAFLRHQLRRFKTVLFVPGNHEAYETTWPLTIQALRKFQNESSGESSLGNFVLLDRASYRLPGTKTIILGCSLFSSIPAESAMEVEMRLNDFYFTEYWTVAQHNAAHKRDLQWLNEEVSVLDNSPEIEDIIILTHWSPSTDVRSLDPKHKGSLITSAFSTDLSEEYCFGNSKVKVWAFGHTHWNCDFQVEREDGKSPLRLVTNQRGYSFAQADGFESERIINPNQ